MARFFFSSRRRHTRFDCDWSSDVCSSDLYLPPSGEVLDLGCGFGLFSLYYASIAPGRFVRGLDLNGRRIAMARHAAARLAIANVAYRQGDARDVGRSEERRVGEEGRSRWSPYH